MHMIMKILEKKNIPAVKYFLYGKDFSYNANWLHLNSPYQRCLVDLSF